METAALLGLLLERGTSGKLMIVLGARPGAGAMSKGLTDLLRRHQPVTVAVGPLAPTEVEALAADWPGAAQPGHEAGDAGALYGQTGGVPLLLTRCLASKMGATSGPGPVNIEELAAARTQDLESRYPRDAAGSRHHGLGCQPRADRQCHRGRHPVVRRALDRVVDGGGLLDSGPDAYAWRHPLVRQAVIDTLDQAALRRVREAVGEAWADQGEALRAARQAVEVLQISARRLLPVVLAGVDEALRTLAFEAAEDLCRHALEIGGRSGDPDTVVALLNRLGRSFAYRGRRHDAVQAWEDAAGIAGNSAAGVDHRSRPGHRALRPLHGGLPPPMGATQ